MTRNVERSARLGEVSGIEESQFLEDLEIAQIAGDQLMDSVAEEGGGEQGIGNPFPAELMPFHQLEGAGDCSGVQAKHSTFA